MAVRTAKFVWHKGLLDVISLHWFGQVSGKDSGKAEWRWGGQSGRWIGSKREMGPAILDPNPPSLAQIVLHRFATVELKGF